MNKSTDCQTINILGSTGSVGTNALDVVRRHPKQLCVTGLAANRNVDLLYEQALEFMPKAVFVEKLDAAALLQKKLPKSIRVFCQAESMREYSKAVSADILLAATSGVTSLHSVLDAIDAKRKVALANKEILVVAGQILMEKLKQNIGATLIPVDSEHSAIFQCLQGHSIQHVERLILTSSGGPLRTIDAGQFSKLTKEFVISHPRWKMGKKISVDSATLMNKGLEVIEASWLFGLPVEKISVLIHPEAIIHSMVEFVDGSTLAQLGVTDMKLPIQYAFSYPDRLPEPMLRLDWSKISSFTFGFPDTDKFPCLRLAYEVARQKGSAPCVLSAADEIAVEAYLSDALSFNQIPQVIEKVLEKHKWIETPSLFDIESVHLWAVDETRKLCQKY